MSVCAEAPAGPSKAATSIKAETGGTILDIENLQIWPMILAYDTVFSGQ
jgi:hypothetical protein